MKPQNLILIAGVALLLYQYNKQKALTTAPVTNALTSGASSTAPASNLLNRGGVSVLGGNGNSGGGGIGLSAISQGYDNSNEFDWLYRLANLSRPTYRQEFPILGVVQA